MHVTGSCQCGGITFEADADPATSGVCHCTDCQRFSGAPWRASVRARADTLKISGTPSVYVKTADSGTRRGQTFCPTCGSALYAFTPPDPEMVNLRLGAVDQRADLPPHAQIWCDSALPWAREISGLPARPGQ